MHSHLDIQLNNQSLALPENFSMDVTEENPLFHDNGMYSTPVQAPMEGNRHVFMNLDDPNSDLRPISMEHMQADIAVSGLPFRHGTVVIQEGEELKDAFSFNIDESTQSFSDLIGDLKCQDVPLYNNEKIPIGQKICNVEVHVTGTQITQIIKSIMVETDTKDIDVTQTFEPQALGFSYPGETNVDNLSSGKKKDYPNSMSVKIPNILKSYINVSEPYEPDDDVPGAPAAGSFRYCNARVCYTHYGLDTSGAYADIKDAQGNIEQSGTIGETTSDIMSVNDEQYGVNEDYGPYWVLDANRPQSGICFYVLYFLDCLFSHLGVAYDDTALTAIEDLRRLAFFTTHCKYMIDEDTSVKFYGTSAGINGWLDACGCGGRIEVLDPEDKKLDKYVTGGGAVYYSSESAAEEAHTTRNCVAIETSFSLRTKSVHAYLRTMYATSENFPDASVKDVLDSLEASFGIRFRYDYQHNKVTAYLMRDVFRKRDGHGGTLPTITLPCEVLEVNKLSEKITGVRVKYSSESDGTEQQRNVRTEKRDYETDFNYIDYREGRTRVCVPESGQQAAYPSIAKDLKTENVTCYVDTATGNAYRFKISKDVVSANVKFHRLFEVGMFKGIEVGDCSPANKDFVKELVSGFLPMSFNDVNAYAEQKRGSTQSLLAAFVDEDMEHEFVTQKINHPIYEDEIDIYATEVLKLVESYDPTSTDDGNSPLQSYDWGLAVAIMRGGGTDARVVNFDAGYDGFGNSKWRTVAGKYAMTSDTMDQFGNGYDYNGQGPNGTDNGDGGGERFSLKIRACKPFLYYTEGTGSSAKTHVTSDLSLEGKYVSGNSGPKWLAPCSSNAAVMRRGLADTFLAELIWFWLNAKKLRIHLLAEPAALIDIPNHWDNRFQIGKYVGYIDKVNYSVDVLNGLGEVTVDFYAV